ncbi:MAG TPA: hypothetical protein VFT05_17220 [Burkholderiaceae bacterium]|jgi:hypothetical protein|nr:hypothetical protein [Burkholderiaceae bacterium]
MRTMFAASLLLLCTCAHALDDTPTQSVYMGPRGEEVRTAVGVRQTAPPPARRPGTGRKAAPPGARAAPTTPRVVSSGRSDVQPWLAIRQPGTAGGSGQK